MDGANLANARPHFFYMSIDFCFSANQRMLHEPKAIGVV